MNYQYRYGTSFTTATKTLYSDGGLRRYYQGISAALIQGMSSASQAQVTKRQWYENAVG